MADIIFEEVPSPNRFPSRPTIVQVKAIIAFMEKHRDLAKKKPKHNNHPKFKKLWSELADIVNSLEGTVKSTRGWVKFWADKKRFLMAKLREIDKGKPKTLTALEQRILNLSDGIPRKKTRLVKQEPCNEDGDLSGNGVFGKGEECNGVAGNSLSTDNDDKQLTMFEKMVEVMDQQATAMSQIAQASLTNSKALARLAEASHSQAVAVDRLVGTFDSITSSAHDVRHAILGIDYTLKRLYPNTHRQNSTLFS